MKRKFKLKNNLKFYGIISLTFMLLIALGFMGVRDYDGRKNDVMNNEEEVVQTETFDENVLAASASCVVYNGTFKSCSGSCKFSGTIATCTAGSCVAYATANYGYAFSNGKTTSSCSFSSYRGSALSATKTTATTKKKTSTNNAQIGYFTCVNCTVTSCSGSCSYVSGGTSAACSSMDCIVSAKARDGYSFSNGSTISSTRISKTSGGSLSATKITTASTGTTRDANAKKSCYSLSGNLTVSSKTGAWTGNCCYGNCSITVKPTVSGHSVATSGSCSNARSSYIYSWGPSTLGRNTTFYECGGSLVNPTTAPVTTTDNRASSIQVVGSGANITCSGKGCSASSGTAIKCAAGSSCSVTVTGQNGNTISLGSNCISSYSSRTHTINNGVSIVYYVCAPNTTTSTTSTTSTKKYGGGGTPAQPTTQPKTEPKPGNNSTTTVNKWVWAKGPEYQGETIACGDKLYITTCTNDNDPICNVTNINGKEVKNTKIRKSNYTENEADTGCFQNIKRYVKEKTFSYTNSGMSEGKTEIDCGSIVVFTKSIDSSCSNGVCEVTYNGKKIYLREDMIVANQPTCAAEGTCTTSPNVTEGKGEYNIRICKDDDTEEKRNSIVTCAADYEKSYKLTNDTCKDNNSNICYKEYKYTCSYIRRPGVSAVPGALGANGKGTITITGYDYGNVGLVGYHVSNGTTPTENSSWTAFTDSNYVANVERSAGTYFIWTMNKKNRLSYQVMAKVYDPDLSTTLSEFSAKDADGNNVSLGSLDKTLSYNEDGLVDAKYALLSNNLLADSGDGFDKLTTAYEINTTSNKIAIYATLTSSDASYVAGYEPRTIDLEYGRNVALIKIVNSAGRERTYTFIINRIDDRNNSNLLKNIKLSRGKIDFDPYVTNYTVEISRFTKNVSINAELDSSTASFIEGYEPRKVQITEDVQSAILKVMSEAGSIRSYVITFVRKGNDDDINDNTYLSSLTVPGTQLGFDKNTLDYTITIPYDSENVPVYAFAESDNAVVTVSNNTGLKVGNNLIEIEVKNGKNVRVYSLHVIRKESGLDVSNSAKLDMLTIKNYNIDFNKDVLDYTVKIKREKTLLIAATPESNRADVYMYGNNDLTGFSTVRVKVIAENGLTNIYSIDIQKDAYNKKFEIIASVSGGIIVIATAIIIVVKKSKSKKKEYLEG